MSDPAPGTPSNGSPARNMADIARLFLDGARASSPVAPRPRIGPAERLREERAENAAISKSLGDARGASASWELPARMLGITRSAASWPALTSAAAALAQDHATTVGLLGMQGDQLVIELAGQESDEDLPRLTLGIGSPDLQIARALFTLREVVAHWIIAAPDTASPVFARIAALLGDWLIACPCDNDAVLSIYQQLKRAIVSSAPTLTPHAYMLSADRATAAGVHGRLRKATREFLHQDLGLAGIGSSLDGASRLATISIGADEAQQSAAWTAILDELCPSDHEEAEDQEATPFAAAADLAAEMNIESALERVSVATAEVREHSIDASAISAAVFDQLAHVLDPEERAALSADLFPEEPEVAAPAPVPPALQPAAEQPPVVAPPLVVPTRPTLAPEIRKVAAPQPVAVAVAAPIQPVSAAPAPATPAATPPAPDASRGMTLRAFDILDSKDRDRATQWEAVERSIRDLVPDSILLDARPPMSWAADCCIAMDPSGGLHVWTLYKDGVSWFALREWAQEHRNLLALTRRDLTVSRDLDVSVHIALPLQPGSEGSSDVKTLLRSPSKNVFVYRLRALEWNGRRGIIVVPIA